MSRNPTCLVTGATGAVGPSVVRALHAEGYDVSVLSRGEPPARLFPGGVDVLRGDVTDAVGVRRAASEKDLVVHMASCLHINRPSAEDEAKIEEVNVRGTENVVNGALAGGAARVILISTIAVYGYSQGGRLTEESPTKPDTIYGRTKRAAEEIALGAKCSDGSALSTVLRLAAVYGPRIKGNYQTLLRALARRRFVPIGAGKNRRTLVHSDDVGAAVCAAARSPQAAGGIYNVTDGSHHELERIIEEMCHALGRRPPRLVIPPAPALFGARLFDRIAEMRGREPKIVNMMNKYLEEVVVDGGKIRTIGFEPRLGLREGWAETVGRLRAAGEL